MTLKTITTFLRCKLLRGHDWTSAAMEGRKPTQAQREMGLLGYYGYAEMYCKRCGKVSQLSINDKRRALGLPDGR